MNPIFTLTFLGATVTDTVVVSAALTLLLGVAAFLGSRRLSVALLRPWQAVAELYVAWVDRMVSEIFDEDPGPYAPLIGTLMLFIGVCNLLSAVPVIRPPTADLSATAGLALVVFLAVPAFGIWRHGVRGYLRGYVSPHPAMLPFNLISELTRTLALAVRLFGNVMSAQLVGAVILVVAGVLVPLPLLFLGIITGLIQAYIFGVLASVFIAAAVQSNQSGQPDRAPPRAMESTT